MRSLLSILVAIYLHIGLLLACYEGVGERGRPRGAGGHSAGGEAGGRGGKTRARGAGKLV